MLIDVGSVLRMFISGEKLGKVYWKHSAQPRQQIHVPS